ncbi:MAG: hypothetical protein HQ472_00665 [Ignavibacteria bacterium]|nr:hypothetical protein [Ignavibacteria bacterium]
MLRVLLLFAVLVSSTAMNSQPSIGLPWEPPTDFEPCPIVQGGCPEAWSALKSKVISISCGGQTCSVTVYFKCRLACGSFMDISIGWIDGYGAFLCGPCMSSVNLIEIATAKLLQSGTSLGCPFVYPINNDECITTYRAQSGACFVQGPNPFSKPIEYIPENYWWLPCRGDVCCVRAWQVCKRFGALVATPIGAPSSNANPNCPAPDPEHLENNCYRICGE